MNSSQIFHSKLWYRSPIINGYQMPRHRNGCSLEKTLAFKGGDTCYVSIYSHKFQVLQTKSKPEFVLKGKETRIKVAVDNVKYQWSPSGSYRLELMLKSINNLLIVLIPSRKRISQFMYQTTMPTI